MLNQKGIVEASANTPIDAIVRGETWNSVANAALA
jgi:hypothetical protein